MFGKFVTIIFGKLEAIFQKLAAIVATGASEGYNRPLIIIKVIFYASWGPIFWPLLRSSARAPTIKAVKGTVAIKAFSTIKRAVRSPYSGVRSPYGAIGSPYGGIRSPCGPLLIV